MSLKWEILCDGASSPQQGPNGRAGAAFIAFSEEHHRVPYSRFLRGTVNRAEVTAILLALEWAYENRNQVSRLLIRSDSTFAVRTIAQKLNLAYITHNHTKLFTELYAEIEVYYKRLGGASVVQFAWSPREEMGEVDKLAKAAKYLEE